MPSMRAVDFRLDQKPPNSALKTQLACTLAHSFTLYTKLLTHTHSLSLSLSRTLSLSHSFTLRKLNFDFSLFRSLAASTTTHTGC